MRPKRSHDENRKVCCFFCLRKGETKSDKELSAYEVKLIIDNFLPTFENIKDFLPLGCCGSCRRNLYNNTLWVLGDLNKIPYTFKFFISRKR